MIQLSDIKKKSDANAPAAKSAGRAAATKASKNSQVGYEVLYGRRSSSVHVPLSLPKEDTSHPSTGSALLDSFVNQAIAEPIALQHLRLVNVANRQPVPLTTQQPATPKPSRQEQAKTALQAPPTAGSPTAADPTAEPPGSSTTVTAKTVSPQPPAPPLFKPAVNIPPLPKSPTARPSAPAAAVPATNQPSRPIATPAVAESAQSESAQSESAQSESAQSNAAQSLTEQPPAAAEPDYIQPISQQTALKQKPPLTAAPTIRRPPTPAIAPTPSAAPSIAPTFEDSRTARDSAAAVGLIDINDTLLFGGDHENLASTDPFVGEDMPSNNDTGVLAYISQQVSAFTVSKLKGGFPNNTDPKVINRPDPPKHKTVLDIQNFKLSQLDGEGPTIQRNRSLTAVNQGQSSAPEINVLSQQVNALNQKIAELSQQLAQVTKAQASQ